MNVVLRHLDPWTFRTESLGAQKLAREARELPREKSLCLGDLLDFTG